uniref:PQ-loop repeat-containing protein 1 n=1 Tax=Globodera rostochiensis TaxID=31243 RepID=A0A914HG38_GLORO
MDGDFISAFWKWNDLSSFVFALGLFTALCSLLNAMFHKNVFFVETMGMSALLVEACLGVPQLVRNFQRKSTIGMSVKMVLMWFIGDVGKTIYFVVRHSPEQFWICSLLQISIDVLILLQVWAYGQHSAAGGGANGGGGGGTHDPFVCPYATLPSSSYSAYSSVSTEIWFLSDSDT